MAGQQRVGEQRRDDLGNWFPEYKKFGKGQNVGDSGIAVPTDGQGSGVHPMGHRGTLWLIKAPAWADAYDVTFYRRVRTEPSEDQVDFWLADETVSVSSSGESLMYVQASFGDELTLSIDGITGTADDSTFSVLYKFTNDVVA